MGRRKKLSTIEALEGNPGKRLIEDSGIEALGEPFVAEHWPQALEASQAGVAPPHSPSPAHPRQVCVPALQMGVAAPQLVPAGFAAIVPSPLPAVVHVNVSGIRSKCALTDCACVIVTMHVPLVLVHAPD